jgi:hypothetical protein
VSISIRANAIELGFTRNVMTLMAMAFYATGNNLQFGSDLYRRAVLCQMDAGVERPELRTFKRKDLLKWVKANRAKLVVAGLTVLRAWRVARAMCFRPLAPTDSVTMEGRLPVCLLCTLDSIRNNWRGCDYDTPEWRRARCLNCSRPIRVYPQPRNMFSTRPLLSVNAQACCDDCRRAVRNERNNLRRRGKYGVTHAAMACVECGRSFTPKRADAVTCSNRCRQARHRQRASSAASS